MQLLTLLERPSFRYGVDEGVGTTFDRARNYIRALTVEDESKHQSQPFDLQVIGGIYIVTRNNQVVGKGLHFETAIADFESNLDA